MMTASSTFPDRPSWLAHMLGAGFRPFFLLTALHALSGLIFWGLWLVGLELGDGVDAVSLAVAPYLWHGHEMLFGFLTAAVAGFLLTAVPNWTQTAPVQGRSLAVLVGLWGLGRLAFWTSAWWPTWLVMGADLAFLPTLAWMLWRPLRQAQSKRNLPFVPLLIVLTLASLLDHGSLAGYWSVGGAGRLIALDVVVTMMVIIGGRIAPTFSRNWLLARQRPADVLAPVILDRLAIGSSLAVLLGDVVSLGGTASAAWPFGDGLRGLLLLVAALAVGLRLVWWKPWRVFDEPLLWILHLGLAWVVAGFVLRSYALLGPLWGDGSWSETTALHAHMVGAAGSLILGVMGRAGLGHSGRPLAASPMMVASYLLVSFSGVARLVGANLFSEGYGLAMGLAALLWVLAFTFYLWTFIPILAKR
jgi:uncharacterized protein involved in response to NO